jgi:hypothetical protein
MVELNRIPKHSIPLASEKRNKTSTIFDILAAYICETVRGTGYLLITRESVYVLGLVNNGCS